VIRALALALGLWLVAGWASAQTQGPKGGEGPCMGDVQRLCANEHGGHGEVMKCLHEHESELSPGCKEKMTQAKAKMQEHKSKLKAACGDDAQRLCPGMEGGPVLMKCLHQHDAELSKTCHETMHAGAMHPPASSGH
jgi:hypothetical protein